MNFFDKVKKLSVAAAFGAAATFVAVPAAHAEDQQLLRELDGYTNGVLNQNKAKIAKAKNQLGAGIRG